MGASDGTASPTEATPETDSVSPVNTETLTPHEANAERLRNALVDKIRESGYARTPAVEHALRNVERHLFVPDAPLEQAYANAPVNINAQHQRSTMDTPPARTWHTPCSLLSPPTDSSRTAATS